MSRFSGRQGKGARVKSRTERAWQAHHRQTRYWKTHPAAADSYEMLPPELRGNAPQLPPRLVVGRGFSEVDCG